MMSVATRPALAVGSSRAPTAVENDEEGQALEALLAKITRERGVPCAGYKQTCLRRRLQVRLRATGSAAFAQYSTLLDESPQEWMRLLDALTINVTQFFRDAPVFERLHHDVLGSLPRATSGRVPVWSAACSSGEEAWTLAMLLAESHGLDGVELLGTDVDATSLRTAASGAYSSAAVRAVPETFRTRWFGSGDLCEVRTALRSRVRFARHDLLAESTPGSAWSMISCRNVLIYFAKPAQEALFARFADALVLGGVLVLGKVETLSGAARGRFETIDARERIYRRIA